MTSSQLPSPLPLANPWEAEAIAHVFPEQPSSVPRVQDPLVYPGLYCPSGFDVMSILVGPSLETLIFRVLTVQQLQVRCRPHPVIDLGPVDCSVSLTLCDLELPDWPIVYASEGFYELTGYTPKEVLGRNCRFLQSPGGAFPGSGTPHVECAAAIQQMSKAVRTNQEIQVRLCNYKKDGQRFTNILSIIPLEIGPFHHRYAVGLQCEV
ncbi:White collar 1 protein-like protein [Hapsidospora chrysogenum ATCC 11550]|uniref:White collar 1 protein-like protein n=1 Tax=Hapsidospora chrysogenum (strain ATCC 11550 / CBS 779.69 / DSM 880 / IAM 14645 / JCM 23072 / IMI 49137) TaxID=857340 RepID=A0A086SVL0_HAPC1|nr:White collar 1 protein-like protein [Hapsidospora chrysogenum ATCC 11550]